MKHRIAVFGLGAIGFGIALNLLREGFSVNIAVHRKLENVQALQEQGALVCATKSEAVEACDVVLLCLPSSAEVELVIEEIWSALKAGQIVLDMGTSSVKDTITLCEKLAQKQVLFAEAPVAGGKVQAENRELGAFVGASDETFQVIEPVLAAICQSVQHFGPVGAGAKAKLISNYLVLNMVRLIIETFHAADSLQIDWKQFYEIIERGSANSGALQRMIGSIVESDDYTGYVFSVKNTLKDLEYIAQMSKDEGLDQYLDTSALQFFKESVQLGLGELMVSELLRGEIREILDRNYCEAG